MFCVNVTRGVCPAASSSVRIAKRDRAVDEMALIANGDDCTSIVPVFAAVTTVCSSDATIIVSEREMVFPGSMRMAR